MMTVLIKKIIMIVIYFRHFINNLFINSLQSYAKILLTCRMQKQFSCSTKARQALTIVIRKCAK